MTDDRKPQPIEIQLAVLDSKMDGIQNTLNVRLQSMDDRIDKNNAEIKSVERHAEAGRLTQSDAFAKLLEAKADKVQCDDRYDFLNGRVKSVEGDLKKGVWIVLAAVFSAILIMVLPKPNLTFDQHKPPVAVAVSQ